MRGEEDLEKLAAELLNGNIRALSRLMSIVEAKPDSAPGVMKTLYSKRKPARRIGVSGPPGAGKSSLISNLILEAEKKGEKVAVLCIDPTSPISGGALLGDRIRMSSAFRLKNIFIRSVASGGSLGGLSQATKCHTQLLEAFGFDIVLIETVGLGQIGYDIRNVAETLILVLVPESGDTVQILKSGILELADIVVVNKADRDGAGEIAESLKNSFFHPRDGWDIPVLKTIAIDDVGTDEILLAIENHFTYLEQTHRLEQFHDPRTDLREAMEFQFKRMLMNGLVARDPLTLGIADMVAAGEADPYSAAENILKILFKGEPRGNRQQSDGGEC